MNDKRQIPEPDACVLHWDNSKNPDKRTLYCIFVTGNKGEGRLLRFWLAVEGNECVSFKAEPGVLPFRGVGRGWYCDTIDRRITMSAHRIHPEAAYWPTVVWRKAFDGVPGKQNDWINPKAPNDMRAFNTKTKSYVDRPTLALRLFLGLSALPAKIDYLTKVGTVDGDPQYRFRLGEGSRVPPVKGSKLAKALWLIRQAGRTEVTAKELETVIRQGLSLL